MLRKDPTLVLFAPKPLPMKKAYMFISTIFINQSRKLRCDVCARRFSNLTNLVKYTMVSFLTSAFSVISPLQITKAYRNI